MKNELNRIPTEESFEIQRPTNKIISIILAAVLCVIAFYFGIKDQGSIIDTVWFSLMAVLSVIISFKLKIDGSAIYSKLITIGIFAGLLLISFLLNLVLRLLGLNLQQWTF